MSDATNNNALNAINPLSYMGVNPRTPPNFVQHTFAPGIYDSKNFQIGTIWLNTGNAIPPVTPPRINDLYVLVALYQGQATWLPFSAGDLQFLTGNSGGPVPPTANNINVVGDGSTITVVGTPGTSTLTISVVGTGVLSTLTGNSGGAVSPLAGNINVVGTGVITVVGNPGAHTLTVTPSGAIASSFITNPATGTATPVAGVLTFAGTGDVVVSAAGSTVTINGTASGTVTTLHTQDGNNVTPTAGVINISGSNGLTTTGTAGPNTVTVTLSAIPAFGAYVNPNVVNATGDGTQYQVIFNNALFNVGSNYNTGTGVFTAPTTGIYEFNVYVGLANITDQTLSSLVLVTTAAQYETNLLSPVNCKRSDNVLHLQMSATVSMSSGDTASMLVAIGGGGNAKTVTVIGQGPPGSPIACYFSGNLVH